MEWAVIGSRKYNEEVKALPWNWVLVVISPLKKRTLWAVTTAACSEWTVPGVATIPLSSNVASNCVTQTFENQIPLIFKFRKILLLYHLVLLSERACETSALTLLSSLFWLLEILLFDLLKQMLMLEASPKQIQTRNWSFKYCSC